MVQVYGWLLHQGRVLVQDTGSGFNLPGGRPEPEDADLVATLRREAREESQVTVAETRYLGYERVVRSGQPRALVRMVGVIDEFLPRHPDPDGGRLLGRLLCPLSEATHLLDWGTSGQDQSRAAAVEAEQGWGISVPTSAAALLVV
ncbi:8-oxo-dGTP pyrophosphatase MutT (NUDIX family) [Saccharopolyspora lacisalsi]|uniref:8-oxo-dGTP pyrophosphatase MutT (NUDIX family) n=1 Tax=Halosaccharopolyspora lacisalsi TaxID=1000566 RepID=A0A839E3E9_9PSEU|nr:NUDIX domain-containing protein [Halosaccharopolyspora lacisalsi]MBA8827813.1 8-oxo-dGTP pyrophosphatase MutT (NUDIX family) [Halosaccharopolyspora lacisalsi]